MSDFNVGDRVWYGDDPRDTGTVDATQKSSETVKGAVWVVYDSGEAAWTDTDDLHHIKSD